MPNDPTPQPSDLDSLRWIARNAPSLTAAERDVVKEAVNEIERLRTALRHCISGHETGRYEPQRIAYENAKRALSHAD